MGSGCFGKPKSICSFVNDHPRIKNAIQQFVKLELGHTFNVIPTTCDTRFAEYVHHQLEAILKNVKVLIEALPSIECNSVLEEKKKFVLKHLLDTEFIAKLIAVKDTFAMISSLEKVAQFESFGPFDFFALVKRLEKSLETGDHLSAEVMGVLENHVYDGLNLAELSETLAVIELRRPHDEEDSYCEVLSRKLNEWYASMLKNIDHYLAVPEIMRQAVHAFDLKAFEEKSSSANIDKLFELSNCEHFQFSKS